MNTDRQEQTFAAQENALNEELKSEETVRVKLPLIDPRDAAIEVGINGVIKTIRRGVAVELPRSIVEVLEHGGIL